MPWNIAVPLPLPSEVRVFAGVGGKRRGLIRALYAERCSLKEISEYLGLRQGEASTAIRYKSGDNPLCLRQGSSEMAEVAEIPPPAEVKIYGAGAHRRMREMYVAGRPVEEIASRFGVLVSKVSRALRHQKGVRREECHDRYQRYMKEKAAVEERYTVTGPHIGFEGPLRCSI